MNISKKSLNIIFVVNAIFFVAATLLWFLQDFLFSESWEFQISLADSISLIMTSLVGSIIFIILGNTYKLSTSSGKVWFSIGLGLLGWCIGEIIYMYYDLFTDEAPFPSIADLFYLVAYLPLAVGLIIQVKLLKIKLPKVENLVILIIFIAVAVISMLSVLIFPIQTWYEGEAIPPEDIFELTIAALYPIFDLLLLFCVMIVFAKLRKGEINIAWILLLLGILLNVIADLIFNYFENVLEIAPIWPLYDLLFLISYVFMYVSGLAVLSITTGTFDE